MKLVFRRGQSLLAAGPIIFAVLGPSAAAAQGLDDEFSGISNVSFQFYDVTGRTLQAIRASLEAQRLKDNRDGFGRTYWHLGWSLRAGPEGCHIVGDIFFTAEVTLPRLADEANVPGPLLARWKTFMAGLRIHEAGHARYAFDHMGDVQRALEGKTCDEAKANGEAAIKALGQYEDDYDRVTKHGATQGAVF